MRHVGVRVNGRASYHHLGDDLHDGKKKKIHLGLRRPLFDEFTHNDETKTGDDNRGEDREELRPSGSPGDVTPSFLGPKLKVD
jgi:hypothetical protein